MCTQKPENIRSLGAGVAGRCELLFSVSIGNRTQVICEGRMHSSLLSHLCSPTVRRLIRSQDYLYILLQRLTGIIKNCLTQTPNASWFSEFQITLEITSFKSP